MLSIQIPDWSEHLENSYNADKLQQKKMFVTLQKKKQTHETDE